VSHDLRTALELAESELRLALMAERAGISGAGMRRMRAEINVSHARDACAVANRRTRVAFGPDDENEGLS